MDMKPLLTAIFLAGLVAAVHIALGEYGRRHGWSADAENAAQGVLWLAMLGGGLFFLGGGG